METDRTDWDPNSFPMPVRAAYEGPEAAFEALRAEALVIG